MDRIRDGTNAKGGRAPRPCKNSGIRIQQPTKGEDMKKGWFRKSLSLCVAGSVLVGLAGWIGTGRKCDRRRGVRGEDRPYSSAERRQCATGCPEQARLGDGGRGDQRGRRHQVPGRREAHAGVRRQPDQAAGGGIRSGAFAGAGKGGPSDRRLQLRDHLAGLGSRGTSQESMVCPRFLRHLHHQPGIQVCLPPGGKLPNEGPGADRVHQGPGQAVRQQDKERRPGL